MGKFTGSQNLALQFRDAARRACPGWSDKQIAEYVGESRQNFFKAMAGSVSTDRVQSWIRRWNGDGPRPPRLLLRVEPGGADLSVDVEQAPLAPKERL